MQTGGQDKEKELLEALQKGSVQAFDYLYQTYSLRIYSNIYRMVKCQDTTQELLQDVFISVWERREEIDPELSFKAYLYRISRNLVYNYFRRAKIGQKVLDYIASISTELDSSVEEGIAYHETKDLLDTLISQLPPQRKVIYTLCKLEGRSYSEVSQLLNISESTINDHIVKATRFLKGKYHNLTAENAGLLPIILICILK